LFYNLENYVKATVATVLGLLFIFNQEYVVVVDVVADKNSFLTEMRVFVLVKTALLTELMVLLGAIQIIRDPLFWHLLTLM